MPLVTSGTGGMHCERIRAVPSWHHGLGRYDCIFIETDPDAKGMLGLNIARVRLFFSFGFRGKFYPCALVHWFSRIGNGPDDDTGMWIVQRELGLDGLPSASIIHLDAVVRAAHLIGVYGENFLPKDLSPEDSLDIFQSYYVNKYIDHHSFETVF